MLGLPSKIEIEFSTDLVLGVRLL